jgi:phosphoribosylanthranilate isomerase
VKICCIGSVEEAHIAVRHGASAVGLVSEMPSGPGVIDADAIRLIVSRVPPGVATFLLTSRQDVGGIVEQQRRSNANTLQLCDALDDGAHAEIKRALPGIRLVQVIHVTGPEAVAEALRVAGAVDALLLDSGRPDAPTKELGGTGRTHDWSVSAEICSAVDVPVFLAGGLNPANVAEAVARVRPFGVDVCSGLRVEGRLDAEKVAAFMEAVEEVDGAWR